MSPTVGEVTGPVGGSTLGMGSGDGWKPGGSVTSGTGVGEPAVPVGVGGTLGVGVIWAVGSERVPTGPSELLGGADGNWLATHAARISETSSGARRVTVFMKVVGTLGVRALETGVGPDGLSVIEARAACLRTRPTQSVASCPSCSRTWLGSPCLPRAGIPRIRASC